MITSKNIFASHFKNSQVEFNEQQTNKVTCNLLAALSASSTTYTDVPSCIETIIIIINEMLQASLF